jgi:hypothetical protein
MLFQGKKIDGMQQERGKAIRLFADIMHSTLCLADIYKCHIQSLRLCCG